MPDTFPHRARPQHPSFLLLHRILDILPWRFSRTELIQAILAATYLAAGAVLFYRASTLLRGTGLLIIILGAGVGWLAASRRYHLIVDTPTSRIASAAQGYVELQGRCQLHPGSLPLGFRSGPPCVWYRYSVQRIGDSGPRPIGRGQSEETFLLDDGSGQCIVDPNRIEVTTSLRRSWQEGDYHVSLEYLRPGEPVYALGYLTTTGGTHLELDKRVDTSALLAAWKRDADTLHARFDANGDGEIDLHEWQRARAAAEQEVASQHLELRLGSTIHVLGAPPDGRPFLFSNRAPKQLASRFRYWSWFHATVLGVTLTYSLLAIAG